MAEGPRLCPCGAVLPAGRAFCSSWCEARAARGLSAEAPPPLRPPSVAAVSVEEPATLVGVVSAGQRGRAAASRPSLVDRVRERLEASGLSEEWQAEQALDLAERIVDGSAKGTALAALHRELRAVMGDLLRGVDAADSRVGAYRDELASRRARRAGGA